MNKRIINAVVLVTVLSLVLGVFGGIALAKDKWFSDVSTKHWGYEAIKWARDNGIVMGYNDNTYKPNRNVTEAEFLSILLKTYKQDVTPKEGESWMKPLYDICKEMNYPTLGQEDKSKRKNIIDRTKVAEIIAGTQGYNFSGVNAIKYLLGEGLSEGKEAATVEGYHGEDGLTRAEAVQFIKNIIDVGISEELLVRPVEPSNKDDMVMTFGTFDPVLYLDRLNKAMNEKGLKHKYWANIASKGTNGNKYDFALLSDFGKTSSDERYSIKSDYTKFDWDNAIQYTIHYSYYTPYSDWCEVVTIYYDNTGVDILRLTFNTSLFKYDDYVPTSKMSLEALGMEVPNDFIEQLTSVKQDTIFNWGGSKFECTGRDLYFR